MGNNSVFSVDEAITMLMCRLSDSTGFKYLKSQRSLKKTIGQLVFEVLLFSSKWNESRKSVEVDAEFRVSYKKYGPVSTVHSIIASKSLKSEEGIWYDISTQDTLDHTYKMLNNKIHSTAVELYNRFVEDTKNACRFLLNDVFYEYSVALDYLAENLGMEAILFRATEIVGSLNEEQRQQVIDYRNGAKNKSWMINRCNLRFIVDHGLFVDEKKL